MPIKREELDFEYDLKNVDITKTKVRLPVFSVRGDEFFVVLERRKEKINFDCHLFPVDPRRISKGDIRFQ
jgi:hypothetical protein